MPSKPLSVYVLICQRVMQEKDDVFSAVRIVDIFFARPINEVPIEKQAVPIQILAGIKGYPGDHSEHTVQLQLIRPDGHTVALGEQIKAALVSQRYPELPGGFTIVAQIGIMPKQMGTHYVALLFDGEEVARSPFTLREPEQQKAE